MKLRKFVILVLVMASLVAASLGGCIRIGGNDDEPQVRARVGDEEFEAN